jgi:hypothetical protein
MPEQASSDALSTALVGASRESSCYLVEIRRTRQVVHVARREHVLDHLRHAVNVVPVRCDFGGAQAREVCNVTISKDDNRIATSDGAPLEVSVSHVSDVKRLTELAPTKPAPRPLFPGVPVLWPGSCHYLCLPGGGPPQSRTDEANFKLTPLPASLIRCTAVLDSRKLETDIPSGPPTRRVRQPARTGKVPSRNSADVAVIDGNEGPAGQTPVSGVSPDGGHHVSS